ncbi:DUF6192 family protein [Streptomyces sp. NPDC050264]|uniref:DUF6192 family protein n=1 Tax=Streptomyces sp. NPDC050264 TaxID=3155038 RepID=UPI003447CF30
MLAEDIGLNYRTVESRRWTAAHWPAEKRRPDVSYTIHRTLAHIEDEDERFTAIHEPPPHPRTGVRMWTPVQANRWVGHQVAKPALAPGEEQRDPCPGGREADSRSPGCGCSTVR